ncbi:energy transducer TonB family protein [Paludibaculum fermentans]|uniref:energy transducer TonB family protein n=1 Tax=Paludibaculum fermentans TaxID=1473598 RepID=UPI003EBFBEFB
MLESFQRYWHGDQGQLQLLLDYGDQEQTRRRRLAVCGAVLYQLAVILFALNAPGGAMQFHSGAEVHVDVRRSTPLIAPRNLPEFKVTQKEEQRKKPATEVDMAALMPKKAVVQPQSTPPGKPFTPPPGPVAVPVPRPQAADPPKIEVAEQQAPPNLPAGLAPKIPTTPPPVAEPPKTNPFERVGGPQPGVSAAQGVGRVAIAPPKTGVDEAIRAVAQGGGGRGVMVGDVGGGGMGSLSEGRIQNPAPGRNGSTLELLSDPKGIDFRPYLIQVLAAVKRNWQAVLPESARLGRQGRTAIQFSINRIGGVPKLVIAFPSGTEALDRAAVAGISASNPFPPLPAEFTGTEIRLQLVFTYNLPR